MEEILIRDYQEDIDFAFISDSWRRSYYGHSPFTQFISKGVFDFEHRKVIGNLIAASKILMAVNKDDTGLIVGYIVFQPDTLHYVYVKEACRGFRICRQLLSASELQKGARATHLTTRGMNILRSNKFVYCPYFNL